MYTKQCKKCGTTKSISEFYKNRSSKDGLSAWCKICHNADVKRYEKTERGKAVKKRYVQSKKGKAIRRATQKRFNEHYPNYEKARHAVNHAIESGKIQKASSYKCKYCPKQAAQYHHWHGYEPEHWLDVVPVCTQCNQTWKTKIA